MEDLSFNHILIKFRTPPRDFPFQTYFFQPRFHIISELTAAFTDELFTQKVIISEENELSHAVNDLLVRVQSYISERMKEKASIESIDLTTLANHISTSFEKNETRLNRSKVIKKKQAIQLDCPPIPEKLVGILNIDFDKTAPSKHEIQENLSGRMNGEMLQYVEILRLEVNMLCRSVYFENYKICGKMNKLVWVWLVFRDLN